MTQYHKPCHLVAIIDFHTHRKGCERYDKIPREELTVVQSLMYGEAPHPRADFYTIGIHPLQKDAKKIYDKRPNFIDKKDKHLIAIGEIGWDRRSNLSEAEQTDLVRWQIGLAHSAGRGIVFHVVGGWHLLLAERKRYIETVGKKVALPWFVHGFRKGEKLAKQLSDMGIYLSISPSYDWRQEHPVLPFFLESDDSGCDITQTYQEVTKVLGEKYSQVTLERSIESAFRALFTL